MSDGAAEKSLWFSEAVSRDPQVLLLRERTLPLSKGLSLSSLVNSSSVTSGQSVDRLKVLELIYNHLRATGMTAAAETLLAESGHSFQVTQQPWNKTDLSVLLSLGVGAREDCWGPVRGDGNEYAGELMDEDAHSSPYREDPALIWKELLDPELNATFSDGEKDITTLRCGSLRRIVVLFVCSFSTVVADEEFDLVFLALQSLTSAAHFLDHMLAIFDCHLLKPDKPEQRQKLLFIQGELRLYVISAIIKWIRHQGRFIGEPGLKKIEALAKRIVSESGFEQLTTFGDYLLQALPRLKNRAQSSVNLVPTEEPVISDIQVLFKPDLTILDPDPIEVAKQITELFFNVFEEIPPREWLVALSNSNLSHQVPFLNEYRDLVDGLTRVVVVTIAETPKASWSSAATRIIEIIEHLIALGNFQGAACIVRGVMGPELSQIPGWPDSLPLPSLATMKLACGEDEDLATYQDDVFARYEAWEHCLPNINAELKTRATCDEWTLANGLINWEARKPLATRVRTLYRFQGIPYPFYEIPQIQNVIIRGKSLRPETVISKVQKLFESTTKGT